MRNEKHMNEGRNTGRCRADGLVLLEGGVKMNGRAKAVSMLVLLSGLVLLVAQVSRAAEQPAPPYGGVTVLSQTEEAAPGGETIRTTLAQDGTFKYPILRIEEAVVGGEVIDQLAMVGDHIIVRLKEGKTQADLTALNGQLGGMIRKVLRSPCAYLVAFTNASPVTVPDAVAAYGAAADVLYAEPDGILHCQDTTPNDPAYTNLWGLHNTGQAGGTTDCDIDAPEAWDLSRGTGVVVAVIDTGIDYNHVDLRGNMWSNTAEIAGNQVDEDGNGYTNDIFGIDLVNNDSDPMDDRYHGTHCAGTIAAVGNNGTGVVGVAWQAKLMALKFLDAAGRGPFSDAADCLRYVIAKKQAGVNVRVASNSYGGSWTPELHLLEDAIRDAATNGVLFVAAADNKMKDLDDWGGAANVYPACLDESNIVSVAAMDRNGNMSSFSNYGRTLVDLSAPGSDIWSTIPGNLYTNLSGTSMATPHVAGVAALLFGRAPSLSVTRARELLMEGVTPLSVPIAGRTVTDGCVNAARSLALLDAVATPSFNPPAGLYDTNTVQVTMQCQTPGATIRFTTNGLAPDPSSPVYSNAVSVPLGTTVKARAYLAGKTESAVKSGDYLWPRIRTAFWSMDAYPGWTAEGLWRFGVPLGGGGFYSLGEDPQSAATGGFVYGYNLAGDYERGITRYLTTQAFDCSNLKHTKLRFQRWLTLNYSQSSIQISTNGTAWVDVWRVNGSRWVALDEAWQTREYDISAVADGQGSVYLRWVMGPTDPTESPVGGWNIDDVEIWASTPPPSARWAF
jgi:subtilisin family serine protease